MCVWSVLAGASARAGEYAPPDGRDEAVVWPIVYLSWQRDPTTTMTVHWIAPSVEGAPVVVWSKPAGSEESAWRSTPGLRRAMPFRPDLRIHWAEITGLEPDRDYAFNLVENGPVYRFRTLPDDPAVPIRFVAGGCVLTSPQIFRQINAHAAALDPHFALLTGDLAYSAGTEDQRAGLWLRFLDLWNKTMVAPDGRLIPMIVTIGNHEIEDDDGFGRPREAAPFFYSVFALPGPGGYGVLDVGRFLSIIVLDSGHTNSIAGPQRRWLETTLEQRHDVTHLIAAYHMPAYPSDRGSDDRYNAWVRQHWSPLFERHGVDLCFEAHDHCYKRTQPIRRGRVDPAGITYFGDGGWAMTQLRQPALPGRDGWFGQRRWYLTATRRTNHFNFVTLDGRRRTVHAIDDQGNVFDSFAQIDGEPAAVELTPVVSRWLRTETWLGIAAAAVLMLYVLARRRAGATPAVADGATAA